MPLSPNWRLAPDGTGIRLTPHLNGKSPGRRRICSFEIVHSASKTSAGTVSRGDATCPYTDCGRVIDGEEVKKQAQAGGMGEQLFAVVYKRRVRTLTRTGKPREKWVREYRAPDWHDDNNSEIEEALADGMEVWETHDIVPRETIPDGNKTSEPQRYGMTQLARPVLPTAATMPWDERTNLPRIPHNRPSEGRIERNPKGCIRLRGTYDWIRFWTTTIAQVTGTQ